jgi:hypothetical protein
MSWLYVISAVLALGLLFICFWRCLSQSGFSHECILYKFQST